MRNLSNNLRSALNEASIVFENLQYFYAQVETDLKKMEKKYCEGNFHEIKRRF